MDASFVAPASGLIVISAAAWFFTRPSHAGIGTVEERARPETTTSVVVSGDPARSVAPVLATSRAPAVERTREPEPAAQTVDPEPEPASALEAARALRLPVVSAIRTLGIADDVKQREMRDALARSGSSSEPWTRRAEAVVGSWRDALRSEMAGAQLTPPACYRAGCEVLVTFAGRESYEAAARGFRELAEPGDAHGGRVQTPPLALPDGRIQTAWMFLRPDVPLPEPTPAASR